MCRSTSAIRKVPVSVARTKTPTCFYGNTSREEPTCLAIPQAQLDQVALRLNQPPRKTLGFRTPASNFKQVLRRPSEPARVIGHLDASTYLSRGRINRDLIRNARARRSQRAVLLPSLLFRPPVCNGFLGNLR